MLLAVICAGVRTGEEGRFHHWGRDQDDAGEQGQPKAAARRAPAPKARWPDGGLLPARPQDAARRHRWQALRPHQVGVPLMHKAWHSDA